MDGLPYPRRPGQYMITIPDAYVIRNKKPSFYVSHKVFFDRQGAPGSFVVASPSKPKITPWVGRTFSLPEPETTLEIVFATHIPDTNCFLEDL